jgi:hypothetical protein
MAPYTLGYDDLILSSGLPDLRRQSQANILSPVDNVLEKTPPLYCHFGDATLMFRWTERQYVIFHSATLARAVFNFEVHNLLRQHTRYHSVATL